MSRLVICALLLVLTGCSSPPPTEEDLGVLQSIDYKVGSWNDCDHWILRTDATVVSTCHHGNQVWRIGSHLYVTKRDWDSTRTYATR